MTNSIDILIKSLYLKFSNKLFSVDNMINSIDLIYHFINFNFFKKKSFMLKQLFGMGTFY